MVAESVFAWEEVLANWGCSGLLFDLRKELLPWLLTLIPRDLGVCALDTNLDVNFGLLGGVVVHGGRIGAAGRP